MMIRNASGPRPPFLVSEQVLEDLVKPLIADFREPSLSCVKAVMHELRNVFIEKFPREPGLRFPLIKEKVGEILEETMNEYSKAAFHMVRAGSDPDILRLLARSSPLALHFERLWNGKLFSLVNDKF